MSILLLLTFLTYQSSFTTSTPIARDIASSVPSSEPSPTPSSVLVGDPNPIAHLIWGCIATVFATSWVAVHPNIPDPNASWVRRAAVRLEMMLWTVVAPELVVMSAIQQWFAAHGLEDKYRDKGWTLTHGFFIQMGGFVLYDGKINKGVISPHMFDKLLLRRQIAFPNITLQEIEARGHGGGFARGAAVLQTLWFIMQLAAKLKAKGGEGVTQLEFATLAITILNAFMCAFWWFKPRDVRLPVKVPLLSPTPAPVIAPLLTADSEKVEDDASSTSSASESDASTIVQEKVIQAVVVKEAHKGYATRDMLETLWYSIFSESIRVRIAVFVGVPDYKLHHMPPNVPIFFSSQISRRSLVRAYATTTVLGIIFGAIHCAAWNLSFPSHAEALLWRIASGVMVGYLCMFLTILVPQLLSKELSNDDHEPGVVAQWFEAIVLWGICAPIYVAARVYVLVEVFLALRAVNGDVGEMVKWTTFFPHV